MHRAGASTGHLLRQPLGDASPDRAPWPRALVSFSVSGAAPVCRVDARSWVECLVE